MSMQIDARIICPHCSHNFDTKIYRTLWVEYPENRELFLNDEVNKIACPSCDATLPLYEQTSLLCVDVNLGIAVWHEPYPDNQISIDQELYRKHAGEGSFYAKAPRINKWGDFKKKYLEMEAEAIKNNHTPNVKISNEMKSLFHGFVEHIKSEEKLDILKRYSEYYWGNEAENTDEWRTRTLMELGEVSLLPLKVCREFLTAFSPTKEELGKIATPKMYRDGFVQIIKRICGVDEISLIEIVKKCDIDGVEVLIKMLVALECDVNAKDENGLTALMWAARENPNPEVITTLVKTGIEVNEKTKFGVTALMCAAWYNTKPEIIKALIKLGADVNARKADGFTALMCAASNNTNSEVITALIALGADVNAKGENGKTVLMCAATQNPNPEIINVLVKLGAAVNAKDNNGETALMFAANRSNADPVITAILKLGADVRAKNNNGETALMFAAKNTNNPKIITALVEMGAEMNATVLMCAAERNENPEIITTLAKLGADVNVKTDSGLTLLMLAAEYNENRGIIALLAELGVDVNARDSNGDTALIRVVKEIGYQAPKIIVALVEVGADLNAKTDDGLSNL